MGRASGRSACSPSPRLLVRQRVEARATAARWRRGGRPRSRSSRPRRRRGEAAARRGHLHAEQLGIAGLEVSDPAQRLLLGHRRVRPQAPDALEPRSRDERRFELDPMRAVDAVEVRPCAARLLVHRLHGVLQRRAAQQPAGCVDHERERASRCRESASVWRRAVVAAPASLTASMRMGSASASARRLACRTGVWRGTSCMSTFRASPLGTQSCRLCRACAGIVDTRRGWRHLTQMSPPARPDADAAPRGDLHRRGDQLQLDRDGLRRGRRRT